VAQAAAHGAGRDLLAAGLRGQRGEVVGVGQPGVGVPVADEQQPRRGAGPDCALYLLQPTQVTRGQVGGAAGVDRAQSAQHGALSVSGWVGTATSIRVSVDLLRPARQPRLPRAASVVAEFHEVFERLDPTEGLTGLGELQCLVLADVVRAEIARR